MDRKIPITAGVAFLAIFLTLFFIQTWSRIIPVEEPAANVTSWFNQTAMLESGNIAMGFNQSKIHHMFKATPTGGEIMIMSMNMSDTQTVNEIRSHVKDIQFEFSQGNFEKPFYIHDLVPGTDIMTAKRDLIQYSIKDIDDGSVLILDTNDTELLHAIKKFMDFQSSQHMNH